MTTASDKELASRLRLAPAPGPFDPADLAGLPEPVRRHLVRSIAPGTPLARSTRITMRGRLKLGARWLPFRAEEWLAPHDGFRWAARVAGVITGSDHYAAGEGALDWRLLGLVRVMHADGPDVARSALGRAAGEAVWLPTVLTPGCGAEWDATDDRHVTVSIRTDDVPVTLRCTLDDDGALVSVTFNRWGDPDATGTWGWHPFGIDVTATATFGGLTVPSEGRVGWHHGTDRWSEGEFFRYRLTALEPVVDP